MALALIIAAGRATALVRSYVAVDISYAAWVTTVLEYVEEVLHSGKNAIGYGGMAWAMWHLSVRDGLVAAAVFVAGLTLENAARFLIDLLSSALVYYGVAPALISVGIQLVLELALAGIAFLVLRRLRVRRERGRGGFLTCGGTARTVVLIPMVVRLGEELVYLCGYLLQYGGMTVTEAASATGSFLRILAVYGGAALLLCEAALWCFRKAGERNGR